MTDLHDKARARLAERQLDDERTRLLREILAENEQLLAENEQLKEWVSKVEAVNIRLEARYAALCEAEPVAHIDHNQFSGGIEWNGPGFLSLPNRTPLIPRPSMEDRP